MAKLINVDNGGTLTDFCVIDGDRTWRSKSVTTPYDLSKCLFDGLRKVSRQIYGKEDLDALLREAACIRYSTTQGTNALVERKGVRLGVLSNDPALAASMTGDDHRAGLFRDLVGERVQCIDPQADEGELTTAVVKAVNALGAAGANRIIIAFTGADFAAAELAIYRVILRAYPSHLLGALPALCSSQLSEEPEHPVRVWTALLNAFLHPAMERFLHSAGHRMRETRSQAPLLIFRNDGGAASVAKTVAIRTYSSGPRGGMEGVKALAAHYGWADAVSFDVGGTTTDIGRVQAGVVQARRRGVVEGVDVAFALCDVVSHGVGGGSIIRAADSRIAVGPQSVGGAPGPACFGFGGTEATITDAYLLMGLLDPATYFGGELALDAERARTAVTDKVATPLKLTLDAALIAMERAWVRKVADAILAFGTVTPDTTLVAFGGGGGFAATEIADALGVRQVVIPGLAAVFSAYGIGFSDISQHYELVLTRLNEQGLAEQRTRALERAEHDMFAEGAALADCRIEARLEVQRGEQITTHALDASGALPVALQAGDVARLQLSVIKPMARPALAPLQGATPHDATVAGQRSVLFEGGAQALPVIRLETQQPGAQAVGPLVLEEDFLTSKVGPGWRFELTASRDILLTRV